jgi:hypothetical protein
MYKIFVLLIFSALMVGCTPTRDVITGSGKIVTQEEAISGFDKVAVNRAFRANISQGETSSVIIRIDDNLLKYLEVVKEGDTLKIGLKTDQRIKDGTLEAEVTLPELTGLNLSAASQATITGFESTNGFSVDLSGASRLHGDIKAGDARFDVSGGGNVILRGSAGDLSVDASGASTVDLADLIVGSANIKASEASRVTVNTSGTLDVDARGASHVYYLGSPILGTTNLEGASTIEQK